MNKLFLETIKLIDGELYNIDYHQKRLDRTLKQFYGTNINLTLLHNIIPEDKRKGLYKCRIVYDYDIREVEFIPYHFRKIETVVIVEANDIEYNYKFADRKNLNNLLEKYQSDDIIIIKNNLVTDSFAANLIFESQSGFYTSNSYLLKGTKRQYLLDKGIIEEKEIRVEDIEKYERIYFINAMIDLEDNISIDISSLANYIDKE